MSSSDRRAVVLSLLAVAGCGFTPVYGPGGSAEGLRGEIAFDPPVDTEGFVFIRQLERRLGLPQAVRYQLSASLRIEDEGAAITPEQVITRFRVLGVAEFSLRAAGTDTILTSGRVETFTSYSATGTTVGTLTAAEDARERLMVILADQVAARLVATAPEWRL